MGNLRFIVLFVLVCGSAWAGPSVDQLVDLPSNEARYLALVEAAGAEPDDAARYQEAAQTLVALEATAVRDPVAVRAFLEAALSGDASLRRRALDAARAGQPAPVAAPSWPAAQQPVQWPAEASPSPAVASVDPRTLGTYFARRLQRGMFYGSVETWGTGLLFWHGAGAGPNRRRLLLDRFGTVEAIAAAPVEEIAEAAAFRGSPEVELRRAEFLKQQLRQPALGGLIVPTSWNVLDGYGAPHSPRTLALRIGDYRVLERIDREVEVVAVLAVVASVATAAMVFGGTFDLRKAGSADGWPSTLPPALAAENATTRRRGQVLLGGAGLVSSGMIAGAVTAAVLHNRLATFWTEEEVDRAITHYNERLREELQLSEQDVARHEHRKPVAPRVIPLPTGVAGTF